MQQHTTLAWVLLILVLGLDGVAFWAMIWQQELGISLFCLTLSLGLLCEGYRRWHRDY